MKFWRYSWPTTTAVLSMVVSATVAITLVVSAAFYVSTLSFTAHPQHEHMVALAMILGVMPNVVMLHTATPCKRLSKLKKYAEPKSHSIIIDGRRDTKHAIVDLLRNLAETTSPKQVIFLHHKKGGYSIGALQAASLLWDSSRMPKVLTASSIDNAMQQVTADTTIIIQAAHVRFCPETISRAMTAFTADEVRCVEDTIHQHHTGTFWARLGSLHASMMRVNDLTLPDIAGVALSTETVTFFRTEMLKTISKGALSPADVEIPLRQRLLNGRKSGLVRHSLGITSVRETHHFNEALEQAQKRYAFHLSQNPWSMLRRYNLGDGAATWLALQVVRRIVIRWVAPLYCVATLMVGGSLAVHVIAVGTGLYCLRCLEAIDFKATRMSLRQTLAVLMLVPLFELIVFLAAPREEGRSRLSDDDNVSANRSIRRPTA